MATRKSYECSVCKKIFYYPSALENHFILHTGEKPHKCQYCGNDFAQKSNLSAHIKRVHYGEKPHKCQYCGNDFAQKSNLSAHIKRVHYGERPHKCSYCGNDFSTKGSLSKHIKTLHSGGKVNKCDFCAMDFALIHDLAVHVNTAHNGKYMCSKCGNIFSYEFVMRIHWQSCQGGRPPRDFADQQNFAI